MATDVVMPQMGESIAEGTIVRWIKQLGDKVDRDEPLFEISTDKVDAEIPSPAAGVLTEIRVREGETVPVNSVVGVIGEANEAIAALPPAAVRKPDAPRAAVPTPIPSPQGDGAPATTDPARLPSPPTQAPAFPKGEQAPANRLRQGYGGPPKLDAKAEAAEGPANRLRQGYGGQEAGHYQEEESRTPAKAREQTAEEAIHQRSSPLVRQIAKEHNVDISRIRGTGISGRVTKQDILSYLDAQKGSAPRAAKDVGQVGQAEREAQARQEQPERAQPSAPAKKIGEPGRTEKLSVMRKKIAEHMMASRRTSAHVHSVFEVNFTRVAQIRDAKKAEYERAGAKLTYLSFIIKAVADALREMPVVNASIDGENVVYHKEINIGIAVALDWGLIVPVLKHTDEKNLLGINRAVADLAERARNKQLTPDDVAGGTFTITNPGVFGALFGMPIINQPQVAILGVGNIEKRPVVIDDAIAIRPMAYLTLGYDHRLIDGAVADQFMSLIKSKLENWDAADA